MSKKCNKAEMIIKLNLELSQKCLYKYHDVGDGLELMIKPTYWCFEDELHTGIEFFARLEGIEVGSVDHELGGYIQYPHLEKQEEELNDDVRFQLQDTVCERIQELWPGIMNITYDGEPIEEIKTRSINIDINLIPESLRHLI